MKIDPDFMRHPRTRQLARRLGISQPEAIVILLNLWAHFQVSKAEHGSLELDSEALAIVCDVPDSVSDEALESGLIATKWLEREGAIVIACGWAKHNAKLIQCWRAGRKGGRPKKPNDKPLGYDNNPTDNPSVQDQEPIGSHTPPPIGQDKIGEEHTAAPTSEPVGLPTVEILFEPETGGAGAVDLNFEGWKQAAKIAGIAPDMRECIAEVCISSKDHSVEHRRIALDCFAESLKSNKSGIKNPPAYFLGIVRQENLAPREQSIKRQRSELNGAFLAYLKGLKNDDARHLIERTNTLIKGVLKNDPRNNDSHQERRFMLNNWQYINLKETAQ